MSPLTLARYFVHFRSFDRVESLTLSYFSCATFDQNTFGVLFHNLILSVRKLCLHHPTACPDSLLRFISIFANLQETMIRSPCWIITKHIGSYTTDSHTLKGGLRLSEFGRGSGPFLSLLGSRAMRYEKITLENCRLRDFLPLQQLISGIAATLRRLDVIAVGDRKFGTSSLTYILNTFCFADRREILKISLSDCVLLEHLVVSVVGPEASFPRINSMISSIASSHFRKFVFEVNLREFPHIYSQAMQDNLANRIGQLDRPLYTLAKNTARGGHGRFLFILLAHNVLKLVQQLTELSGEGDIVTGEKIVGGDHTCVYIPALTSVRKAVSGETKMTYSIHSFL